MKKSHSILLTNEEKIFFAATSNRRGITKGELIHYYKQMSPLIIPHTKKRLAVLQRFPDGINKEGFYQKNTPDYFPSWIRRRKVTKKTEGYDNYIIVQNKDTLIYCINQGCITPHLWLSPVKSLDLPDQIIFDLDPAEKTSFSLVKQVALSIQQLLEQDGLESFAMTTGSRGIHVRVPLVPHYTFETTKNYAKFIAEKIALQEPKATIELRKEKRKNRLFIDIMRNSYGAIAVAPYSVRALDNAPIALPLFWHELKEKKLTAQTFHLRTVLEQMDTRQDPWGKMLSKKQHLPKYFLDSLPISKK